MSDSSNTQGRPPRKSKRRSLFTLRRVAVTLVLGVVAVGVGAAFVPARRIVEGGGFIMTDEEAEVRPSVEGAITRRLAKDGDRVKAGDLLIQLKDTVQQAACDEARDRLKVRQAKLKKAMIAQKLDESQRKQQIYRAKQQLALVADELSRMQEAQSGAFSAREIEEAKLKVNVARSQLSELQLSRDDVFDQNIKVLREEVAAARKQVALCEAQTQLRKITAPLDGTVYFNNFEPGEVVKPKDVLGQVFDREKWIIKLKLPERYIAWVRKGQCVEIEMQAYPGWRYGYLTGRVSRILPVVTPQATGDGIFFIEAMIDNPKDKRLNPGMKVQAEIDTGRTSWLRRIFGW